LHFKNWIPRYQLNIYGKEITFVLIIECPGGVDKIIEG
jgi:hypothetical protein